MVMLDNMNRKYAYSLDFCKFIASIMILLHHYQQRFTDYLGGDVVFEGIRFWKGSFNFGYLVEFFFILSGFFIYTGYHRRIIEGMSFSDFWIRRYLRLIPVAAITCVFYEITKIIYNCIAGLKWSQSINIWATIYSAAGIQEGWGLTNPGINGPLWYISVLLICYFFFYLSETISLRLHISETTVFVLFILIGFAGSTLNADLPLLNSRLSRGYSAFFFGVILGKYYSIRSDVANKKLIIVFCAVVIVVSILVFCFANQIIGNIRYILLFVFYPAIIILMVMTSNKNGDKKSMFRFWGPLSYSIYIWQAVLLNVMMIISKLFNLDVYLTRITTMLLFVVGTVAFSLFSVFIVEKRVNSFINESVQRVKSRETIDNDISCKK